MVNDNPFEMEGSWLRCALHAHTTESDGELAPDLLALHYERAGYDVLAVTDHWKRTEARASAFSSFRASSSTASCPEHATATCSASECECEPAELKEFAGRVRGPRADGRLDRGTRRRRLPRAPVLDWRDARNARSASERCRHRGLQRRLRARGRAWPLGRCTGTSSPRRAGSALRSRATTRTIRDSTPISRGRGCVREERSRRDRPRRAQERDLLFIRRARCSTTWLGMETQSRCVAARAVRSRLCPGSRSARP